MNEHFKKGFLKTAASKNDKGAPKIMKGVRAGAGLGAGVGGAFGGGLGALAGLSVGMGTPPRYIRPALTTGAGLGLMGAIAGGLFGGGVGGIVNAVRKADYEPKKDN
jgi:hypothetical protein